MASTQKLWFETLGKLTQDNSVLRFAVARRTFVLSGCRTSVKVKSPAVKNSDAAMSTASSESLVVQAIIAYSCAALWVVLSAAVILYNKWILAYGGFPYPIALTMFHMGFCSVLAAAIVKLGFVSPVEGINVETYPKVVLPIGALYALVLWTGNSAYLFISVSFIQMLKALAPASVFIVSCLFGIDTFTWPRLGNMAVVAIGVTIASAGEIYFVVTGVVFQLLSMVFESCRLTLIQILLQRRGLKLNPITTLYYIAPSCFLCLLPLFAFIEYPKMLRSNDWNFDWFYMLTNAAVAFALNLSIFLLIGKTSALTMNVAGVIKDWGLILLSVLLYGSPVTTQQYIGYGIAFLAVAYYNYTKYRDALSANKQQHQAPGAEEEKRMLTRPELSPRRQESP
uniref:Plastidic phosphate translocator-like protein n=2 Tax=Tetraselmis sp. GSL018 TaxID=582737 RepID=A0A061SLW6_9CHLO